MSEPGPSGTKDETENFTEESVVDWSNIIDTDSDRCSSSGEEKGFDSGDEIKYFKNVLFEESPDIKCCCLDPVNIISALSLLKNLINSNFEQSNYNCILDNCVRCLNLIFSEKQNTPISFEKVEATDYFFRFRHEFLFKCLCKAYNLPSVKSDRKFSEFGVVLDKDRTPDLILDLDGKLVIIEVTAASSFEKAAQSKGVEMLGFESKYKKEIDKLNEMGVSNVYVPVFFNMGDMDEPISKILLKPLDDLLNKNISYSNTLRVLAKNFSILTNEFKKYFSVSATVLFSNGVEVFPNHPNHEFLYKSVNKPISCNLYKNYTVSPHVYNKISNNWERLYYIMENSGIEVGVVASFILGTNSRKISFEKDFTGLTTKEWLAILENQDKFHFFKNLKLRVGSKLVKATDSDSGLVFHDRVFSEVKSNDFENLHLFIDHPTISFSTESHDSDFYKSKCEIYNSSNFQSVHYDSGYEDVIIKAILDKDKIMKSEEYSLGSKVDYLGLLEADRIDLETVMLKIEENYITQNSSYGLPMKIMKMKSPFILPIADLNGKSYCGLNEKNENLLLAVCKEIKDSNPYTYSVIQEIIESKFNLYNKPNMPSKDLKSLYDSRIEISISINYLQKCLFKINPGERISKTSNEKFRSEFKVLKERAKSIGKAISSLERKEKVKNITNFVRLPTKNKGTELRRKYEKEMEHFKNKKVQSTIEGVGIRSNLREDFEFDKNVFQDICKFMSMDKGYNPDLFVDLTETEDTKLLSDLKEMAKSDYKNLINEVTRSSLGHASAFISRMAHSLMFYSQMPFSSEYVKVDNLGYKNVLLFVKGGKKIFKSKASKLFRLLYPIPECVLPWYLKGHENKGSTYIFEYLNVHFALTPWSMLHESILTESISFYPRVCSFTVLNSEINKPLAKQFDRVALNTVLAFHDRRQTEVLLANLRYILLSTLGDYTGVDQILSEFFSFNYDCFQAFVRGCVLYNYPLYFSKLLKLKSSKKTASKDITLTDFHNSKLENIFTGVELRTQEDLALMIYSTFLMTKAPYQKLPERSNNLKGILKIHELYLDTVGEGLTPKEQLDKISIMCDNGLDKYSDDSFQNDFSIDPKYCALVGNFVNSVLVNQGDSENIQSDWVKIINGTWDDMATSTGLRGNYNDVEDFWGQKGYFVVYKDIFTTPNYARQALELFESNMTDDTKRKFLRDLNKNFFDEGGKINQEFLIFHAVDKVQWRGGREIYVMDISTKTLQQPIEKFMGELCKKLDNELISIPSDRRAQVIHHSIFEKDLPTRDTLTWYLTLDCTKWAPKSVFVKFAIMLLNMPCIPSSFIVHFLNYLEKLYKKRIYFNSAEVKVLQENILYKNIVDKYLIKDDKVKAYYLLMPYSWVMGIFNYTSSFMHAANQKYFSYILLKTSVISFKEETVLTMFAHSDDSGGRLTAQSTKMASRALVLYELSLKSCNHLLSKKKSVVSRIYFEILSVIYLFKQLLALLPKFLGGLRFLPTDKGPSQDLLQSYSKCIEVMVAGANFSVAYLVMKIYSTMVWRFYTTKKINILDYLRPVQYMGLPDAHPLMVLLCGSDSDILRLMRDSDSLKSIMAFCRTVMEGNWEDGPIKPLKFEIKVRGIKKGLEDYLEMFKNVLEKWSVRNVNYHSTVMNSMSFLRKLNDSGFVGSLVNESVTRRVSRSYFMRSGNSLISKLGNIKLSDYLNSITLFQLNLKQSSSDISLVLKEILGDVDYSILEEELKVKISEQGPQLKILEKTLYSPLRICRYMDSLSMENRRLVESQRTLKPTLVQLVKTAQVFSVNFDPASLISFIKEPEMRWALKEVRGLLTAEQELIAFCKNMSLEISDIEPDNLLRVCRTYGRESTKSIYLYSRVPTDLRQIKSYSAFLTFLSVNSFANKEVQGLILKLQNKELGREYLDTNINEDIYFINNCISLISVMIDKCDVDFTSELFIKKFDEIKWSGGTSKDFLLFLKSWQTKDIHFTILQPQIEYLLYKMTGVGKSCSSLKGGAYYTFLKSQKVKNGWYGKGEVYLTISSFFFSLQLDGSQIKTVSSNFTGRLTDLMQSYLLDVITNLGLDLKSIRSSKPKLKSINSYCFGYDNSGRMCILPSRECECGVQSTFLLKRGGFIDRLDYFTFRSMQKDHLLVDSDLDGVVKTEKIYFLPVKKAELVSLIPRIFNKEQFKTKLDTIGLNDFEEFIMTEIMTEYGTGLYIGLEEMLDNYSSSRLYEILKKVKEKNMSRLPKQIVTSTLPAQEGSLMRVLIDYSRESGERIVQIPSTLNPVIMQLRSEYPESMSVLLAEKLIEYHRKIYSIEEIKEISDHYSSLIESDDVDDARNSLIKLMTYWGYGSMVNSLETFTLVRDNRNYAYFDGRVWDKKYISHYHIVFLTLVNSIIDTINHFQPDLKSLKLEVPQLFLKNLKVPNIINEFVKCISLELYGFSCLNFSNSLQVLMFNNLLSTMLNAPEFCAVLQDKVSKNYILGSIPINPKNKLNLLILLNNLRNSWSKNNKILYKLNFKKQLERLPYEITNPRTIMSAFHHTIPPGSVYHHGSLPVQLFNDILKAKEFLVDGVKYRFNFVNTEISDVSVPLSNALKFERPLKDEVFETEAWEELVSELSVEDLDMDTIQEYWSEIEQPYKGRTTKKYRIKSEQIVRAQVNVLVDVQNSSGRPNYGFYRQCGENLIILSTTYSTKLLNQFNNMKVKIAHNFSTPPIFIYTSLSDILNKREIIDKICPGDSFYLDPSFSEILMDRKIRDSDGEIKTTTSLGFKFDKEFSLNREIIIDEKGVSRIAVKSQEEGKISNRPVTEITQYELIMGKIENLQERGLSEDSINKLKEKYYKKAVKDGISFETILNSILKEGELMLLYQDIKTGNLQLNPADSLKTFLAPVSFGSVSGGSKFDNKSIRNVNVKAEIDSFYEGLADKIGSCTLNVSNFFLKTIKSNYKLWKMALKFTTTKKENKNNFLNIFLLMINNANVSNDDCDDHIWQKIMNNGTNYIAQEDETDEDDEIFEAMFKAIPASRLRYRAKG